MSIRLEGVRLAYPGFELAVDLEARDGEWTSILGPSGSGKSTILRLVAGFVAPGAGRILRDGADIGALPPEKRGFGVVFQDQALFPHQTVRGNVEFGLRARGLPRGARRARAAAAMETCALGGLEDRPIDGLSGGERQRVAIARAIAIEPAALLLDEPLAATDAALRRDLRLLLRRIQRERGIVAIGVTHDQDEALAGSDRILLLDRGRVAQAGTPEELWREPANAFAARFIGQANLIPVRALARSGGKIVVRTAIVTAELPEGSARGPWKEGAAKGSVASAGSGAGSIAARRSGIPARSAAGPLDSAAGEVFLFIRADKLRPLASPAASPRIEARVVDCEFRGARYLLRCEAGGAELFAEAERSAAVGEAVVLGFEPADARIIG